MRSSTVLAIAATVAAPALVSARPFAYQEGGLGLRDLGPHGALAELLARDINDQQQQQQPGASNSASQDPTAQHGQMTEQQHHHLHPPHIGVVTNVLGGGRGGLAGNIGIPGGHVDAASDGRQPSTSGSSQPLGYVPPGAQEPVRPRAASDDETVRALARRAGFPGRKELKTLKNLKKKKKKLRKAHQTLNLVSHGANVAGNVGKAYSSFHNSPDQNEDQNSGENQGEERRDLHDELLARAFEDGLFERGFGFDELD